MTKDEALDMALEFVEANHSGGPDAFELITAIKQALAASAQEPVGALILGGVIDTSDGPEYEEWDVEWNTKAVEALQEKLVTSDSVTVMIYTTPPAQPAPVQGCDFCKHPLYAGTKCKNCGAAPVQEPEIVQRVRRYAGQTMRTARNPNITARECIELANWLAANTTPPAARRPWVGLTDEEVDECYESVMFNPDLEPTRVFVYQAIEAKLKEKNT